MKPLQHAVLAASLVLAACGGGSDAGSPSPGPGPAPAAFTLELERTLVPVGQGAIASLTVTAVRSAGFTGAIELSVTGLPAGVTVPAATIASNASSADLALVAASDAPHSLPSAVTVKGTSGADSATKTATVTVFGAAGSLDTSFGGGAVVTPVGIGEDFAEAIAVQPDGKIVVAGSTTGVSGTDVAVVRYERDGALDAGFGQGGKAVVEAGNGDSKALAIALQPDGKIVLAGHADGGASGTDFLVVRLLADGKPDPAFGTQGRALVALGNGVDKARAVAVQPDGKIVVAGDSAVDLGGQDLAIARLTAAGAPDAAFAGGKGFVTTPVKSGTGSDVAYAVALATVDGETRIVVAGGEGDFVVARYTAAGALDASFAGDGIVSNVFGTSIGSAYAIAVQPDGKVVAAGHAGHDFALLRLDGAGAPDAGFGTAGKIVAPVSATNWDEATAVAVQADGRVVAGGWVYSGAGSSADFAVLRFLDDGKPDTAFGTAGRTVTPVAGAKSDSAHALALQADERVPTTRILLAGGANGANNDFAVSRYWP
ncbi:MAG: hypothetical protein U0229_17595 [Anaeromyxobacter sp.]